MNGESTRIPAALGALTALAHVLTASDSYGLFRDELYYLANAEHLGFGYVEHPPMIGWITWIARHLLGESMTALRLLPALAAGVTVALVCLTARELGGGRFSQLLAGTMTALAPIYVGLFGYLSMNAFDVMFHAAAVWVLVLLLRTRDMRRWLPFGVIMGLGLLNKISPLFLGFGVVVGLAATADWEHFRSRWLWLGGAAAAVLSLPYVLWQQFHGWPLLQFMENATRSKNVPLSPLQFLAEQVTLMNPLVVPVALAGLAWLLLARDGRPFRALGWAFVTVVLVMITQRAKPYYLSPDYPLVLAPGALAVERVTRGAAGSWLRPVIAGLVLLSGAALFPLAKPVLPVETFVAYQAGLGLAPGTDERHDLERLPQFFADRLGWPELAETVARVHAGLPEGERRRACIFGQNYGQAGAIDFYGRRLGLPPAISVHNTYHIWGPRDCTGEVVIMMGGRRENLLELFDSVELAATFTCRDCMPYENHKPIWIARGLRTPIRDLWPRIASFN